MKGRANTSDLTSAFSFFPSARATARRQRREFSPRLVKIERDYCYNVGRTVGCIFFFYFLFSSLYLRSRPLLLRQLPFPLSCSIQFYYDGCTSAKLTCRGWSVNFFALTAIGFSLLASRIKAGFIAFTWRVFDAKRVRE